MSAHSEELARRGVRPRHVVIEPHEGGWRLSGTRFGDGASVWLWRGGWWHVGGGVWLVSGSGVEGLRWLVGALEGIGFTVTLADIDTGV